MNTLKFCVQVGNHDQRRLVSKLGEPRARALTVMTLLLPGVSVTYNGDEIGMSDTFITWEDTQDPQGCMAGIQNYATSSRDPARTPFQWDDSVSAGEFPIGYNFHANEKIFKWALVFTFWTLVHLSNHFWGIISPSCHNMFHCHRWNYFIPYLSIILKSISSCHSNKIIIQNVVIIYQRIIITHDITVKKMLSSEKCEL